MTFPLKRGKARAILRIAAMAAVTEREIARNGRGKAGRTVEMTVEINNDSKNGSFVNLVSRRDETMATGVGSRSGMPDNRSNRSKTTGMRRGNSN